MNKFLFTILILLSNRAFAQQKVWHLNIADSATLKGIFKATVAINKKTYAISDNGGVVNIDKALVTATDSITITCIGYTPRVIKPGFFHQFPDTIKLNPSVTLLKEVKVGPAEPSGITLGVIKKKYNTHRLPNPEEEYAQYIPNDKKITGTILSLNYVLNDEIHGIEMPFKIGLYTKSKNSLLPDSALITDTIIVRNPEKKRQVSVDISGYNIQFPEDGIIVCFETLSPAAYGTDSVWYNKGPQGKRWFNRMPGVEMDLKKKDTYAYDDKHNRKVAYGMVIYEFDKWRYEKYPYYTFPEGNNFAFTVTIIPDK